MNTEEINLEESKILNVCKDLASGNWHKYWSENSYLIRPSGNPLTKEDDQNMRSNSDLVIKKEEFVKMNDIKIYSEIVYACFTVHQIFSYKGTENDDISVVIVLLKKDNTSYKLVGGSRSQGRSPSDKLPVFN